jgi:DNA-binding GntR family transcriptional regulator
MATARSGEALHSVDGPGLKPRERPRTTMTRSAVAILRDKIVLGEIPPGQPLRLEEVAHDLQMSVSPIREAIRQLEMIGLVSHTPFRGATVTRLSLDEMSAVYETRLAVESLVVRRVAERFDTEIEERLMGILRELDAAYEAQDRLRVVRGNTRFHEALAASCGSPWLERLVRQVHDVWERYSAALIPADHASRTHVVEAQGHREIVAACAAHDSSAAVGALQRHVAASRAIFERVSAHTVLTVGTGSSLPHPADGDVEET